MNLALARKGFKVGDINGIVDLRIHRGMIKRYTHLRPKFMQNELDGARNFVRIDSFDAPMQGML